MRFIPEKQFKFLKEYESFVLDLVEYWKEEFIKNSQEPIIPKWIKDLMMKHDIYP